MNIEVDYEAINQMAADARNEAKYTKSLHEAPSEAKGPNKKLVNKIKAAEGKHAKQQKKSDEKRVQQKRKSGGFDHDLGSDSESDADEDEKNTKKRQKQQKQTTVTDPEELKRTLFIHNLSHDTVTGDLKDLFPGIQNISLQKRGAKCRGSAFVTMNTVEDATLAVENQSGYSVLGNPIIIEFKKPPSGDEPKQAPAYTASTWVKDTSGESDPRTLFIKKPPLGVNITSVQEVLESEGGPIDAIHFTSNKRSIIIQFATEEGSRRALLTKTFTVRGEEVTLQPSSVSYNSWLGQKSSKQTAKSWQKKSPSKNAVAASTTATVTVPEDKKDEPLNVEETDKKDKQDTTATTSTTPRKKDTSTETETEPETTTATKPKPAAKKVSVFSFKPRTVRKS
eukprot:TRINITY_DN17879_c0_g1_i2.p1 TRINITY_DN17879_c0_g1~~TRINITY_DN17879_c0_g1_i2.p1  ORF type:complete len:407 (+),score=102.69 TRINITY_DN17879_c0_g1_i2:38-1222(+)